MTVAIPVTDADIEKLIIESQTTIDSLVDEDKRLTTAFIARQSAFKARITTARAKAEDHEERIGDLRRVKNPQRRAVIDEMVREHEAEAKKVRDEALTYEKEERPKLEEMAAEANKIKEKIHDARRSMDEWQRLLDRVRAGHVPRNGSQPEAPTP